MLFDTERKITNLSELSELNNSWKQLSGKDLYKLVLRSVHLDTETDGYYYMFGLNGFANGALFSQDVVRKILIYKEIYIKDSCLRLNIEIVGLKLGYNRRIVVLTDTSRVVAMYNERYGRSLDAECDHNFAPVDIKDDRQNTSGSITRHKLKKRSNGDDKIGLIQTHLNILSDKHDISIESMLEAYGKNSNGDNVSTQVEAEALFDMLKKNRDKRKQENVNRED